MSKNSKSKKNQMTKKVFISTLSASLLMGGVLPTISFETPVAQASTLMNVVAPTNVLLKNNNTESATITWDGNGSPEGTEYFVVATPKDASTSNTNFLHNGDNSVFPSEMNFTNDGWVVLKPYFEATSNQWFQPGSTLGQNKLSFDVSIPDTAYSAYFQATTLARSGDNLTINIDGKQVYQTSGYGSKGSPSFALTPGPHKIEVIYHNTGNTSYVGKSFVDDMKVYYTEKEHVDSGWITGNSFTFDNLDPNRDYEFQIKAKNGEERTNLATMSNATNVIATNVANGTQIDWSTVTAGASSYEVFRDGESVYSGATASFNDTDVIGRTEYRYVIYVKDESGAIIGSMYKDITTPAYTDMVDTKDNTGALLNWSFVKEETNVGAFELYKDGTLIYEGLSYSYKDTEAYGASKHNYELKVKGTDGTLLETETLAVAMPIFAPSDVIITNDSSAEKTVQWNHNHNNTDTLYKAIATPVGAKRQLVSKKQNLSGSVFPTDMNLTVNGWSPVRPYFEPSHSSDIWYQTGSTLGENIISFDAEIPLSATSPRFLMSYASVTNDVMEIRVDGVKKWSTSGYNRSTSYSKYSTGVNLTPGEKHKIEIVFKNTGDTNYAGKSFVDDLEIQYYHDGSIESAWNQDNEFTFANLDTSQEYNITVKAKNQTANLESGDSTAVKATNLNVANVANNVSMNYSYLLDGATSYEVLRNGESIYTGEDISFVDTEALQRTNYTYEVLVKNSEGEVIGSTNQKITTPSYTNFTAETTANKVSLDVDYAKDEVVSYEITRNGTVVYEGSGNTFVDTDVVGATNYDYVVNVQNAEGTTIATESVMTKTPINNPSNLQVEATSDTSATVTWNGNNNPANTQYLVEAKPVDATAVATQTVIEDFEKTTSPFTLSGNWFRNTSAKKTGSYGYRSAYIGHRSSTTSNVYVDLPSNATNALVNFDYKVSSENRYDWLTVVVNGQQVDRISGESGWKNIQKALKPGRNTLSFTYSKDSSASNGYDAGFVDNIKVMYDSTDNKSSGWITGTEYELTNLKAGTEYEVTVTAKANGLESQTISSENNLLQEATDAVSDLTTTIHAIDLSTQDGVTNAQTMIDSVETLISELPDGAEKDALLAQVEQLQEKVTDAQNVIIATTSVNELETLVGQGLETQAQIDTASEALAETQELVNIIPDGEQKAVLLDKTDAIEGAIELAQNVLNATEATIDLSEELAFPLETQESIDAIQATLDNTQTLVNLLPENHEVRVSSQETIDNAQITIDTAQATLDVSVMETEITQSAIDKANESISTLPSGDVKNALIDRVEIAQDILDTTNIITDVKSQDITTFDGVDNAIADLKEAEAILNTIPTESTINPNLAEDRETLATQLDDAKWYVAEELIKSLDRKFKGKQKAALSDEALDLLVQYAIHDSGVTTIKGNRGFLMGYLQPLISKFATGNQINTMLEKYLK